MIRLLLCLFCLGALPAGAAGPPNALEINQRLGAPLPLELGLVDESGRGVRLGDLLAGRPAVIVLGYFQCPNLCSTLLDGVLEALVQAELPASRYSLVAVSIDPREGPAEARQRRDAYRPILAPGVSAHFLTGSGEAVAHLSRDAGFPYAWDPALGQYIHPAGFLVATPDGRIARYFTGVRFAPREVRLALEEAAAGRVGTLADRLLLLCSHYDPATGRYSGVVMGLVRAVCLGIALGLGAWIWRRRSGRGA
ncbi:MAG: SCO family protein [Actinomycetota bacterium]